MNDTWRRGAGGFSLIEVLVSTTVLMALSSVAISSLLQITRAHRAIWNRTQMHSGVRSATELLEQEVGQAGRVALPSTVTLTAAVAAGSTTATLSSTSNMFATEFLVVDAGASQETVQVISVNSSSQITVMSVLNNGAQNGPTAAFSVAHASGSAVRVLGGFQNGIVPPGVANGSDGYRLKLFGDVNGDGSLVYVEYTCAPTASGGYLYRNTMPWNTPPASKPALGPGQVLLGNVVNNPSATSGGATPPCFLYQLDASNTYVLDVAITLTVQTQQIDPVTQTRQLETKALLNVSPRNVFDAWRLAGAGYNNRVQPTPAAITSLLP